MGQKKKKRVLKKEKARKFDSVSSSELVELLCARRKGNSTWRGHSGKASDTKSICEGYDEEGYSSMNTDSIRNKLYSSAIKNIPSTDENFWIDLGCGGSALLTLMVLKQHGQCTGIECNPKSAANAQKVLKAAAADSDEFSVLVGSSADPKVVKRLQELTARKQRINVVHEIFGFFASSEGAPLAISQLRASLPDAHWTFLPACSGTFFQPSCLTTASTSKVQSLYVSPKFVLCKKLDFESVRLTDSARFLEWYGFNEEAIPLKQKYTHLFQVTRPGEFNSLSCFLFIDFGPAAGGTRVPRCCEFPFGDERLKPSPQSMSLSSRSSDGAYATNWQNPVILLPQSIQVAVGDSIEVQTEALVNNLRPRYRFSARVVKDGESSELGQVCLKHADLYPDWVQDD